MSAIAIAIGTNLGQWRPIFGRGPDIVAPLLLMRAIALLLVVGCGSAQRPPELVNTSHPSAGCPAAADVRMAHFTGDAHGWFLPLGAQTIDNPASDQTERPLEDHEREAFVPRVRRTWLMMPGKEPCEVTYGTPYAEIVNDGIWNWSFRMELEGCPVPSDGQAAAAIVVFADRSPGDCRVIPSYEVSSFRDYAPGAEPPPLAGEVKEHVGTARANQALLWRIRAIDLRGTAVFFSIDTSRITIGKPDDECNWDTKNLGMFYERVAGKVVPFSYAQRRDTMEVYQHLYSALADNVAIRSVIVTNLGEYQVFDLTKTPRTVGYHLRWYIPNEEDYAGDGVLGPYCGP